MKLEPHQLPAEGLHLEGDEPSDEYDLGTVKARLLTPVHYSLDVAPTNEGFTVVGHLSATVELECVASLDPFPYDVQIDDFCADIPPSSLDPVDLTPLIREDILLALPDYPRKPGVDFVQRSAESKQAADSEPEVWKALDDLNLDRNLKKKPNP